MAHHYARARRTAAAAQAALTTLTLMVVLLLLASFATPAAARQLHGDTSSTYDQCKAAYEAAGGDAGFIKRVSTCASAQNQEGFFRVFNACCAQVKAALSGGEFSKCLCDKASYEWTRGRAAGANIQGVTADNWGAFLGACGIARAGAGC